MHLLFTDSGVGGLSVMAFAERFLRKQDIREPVRMTYVNASRENDFGYNSMGSREEKLEQFDRFLHIVAQEYAPHLIYVACNTLSVLLPDIPFFQEENPQVKGIVETGARRLLQELRQAPESSALIFGTPTTIEGQAYPRMLMDGGVAPERIVSQACPGLADTISEDRDGQEAGIQIRRFMAAALDKVGSPHDNYLIYLACTHYGYRAHHFAAAAVEEGARAEILNPNELVVEELFGPESGGAQESGEENIQVEFVTRYRIPETALETITYFLKDVSPRTVQAFQRYTYRPGLF